MARTGVKPEPIVLPSEKHRCSSPCSSAPKGCPASIHRPPTPPPPFRLLDLPPEVVNQIVALAAVSPDPVLVHEPRFNRHPTPPPRARSKPKLDRKVLPTPPASRGASPVPKNRDRVLSPIRAERSESHDRHDDAASGLGHTLLALLLTCRVLYRDHWAVYYSQNTFEFNSVETLKRFTAALPTRCKNQIRNIRLHMPRKHWHKEIWETLAGMKRLHDIELWLESAQTLPEADVGEWEMCEEGAKNCRELSVLTIRREGVGEAGVKPVTNAEDGEDGAADDTADTGNTHQETDDAGHTGNNAGDHVQEEEQEEDNEVEEEVSGTEQVLRRDRQVEAKINGWLKQREDRKATLRMRPRAKPRSNRKDFPADDSE